MCHLQSERAGRDKMEEEERTYPGLKVELDQRFKPVNRLDRLNVLQLNHVAVAIDSLLNAR